MTSMAARGLKRLWRLYRSYVPSAREREEEREAFAALYPTQRQYELRFREWRRQDRRMNLLFFIALALLVWSPVVAFAVKRLQGE